MILQGLAVEIIRILWDHGYYRGSPWLQRVHSNWFDYWLEYKTDVTMSDVDKQIEELNPNPVELTKPIYWEEEEGETPLGGPIGISSTYTDNAPGGADPLQGAE